MKTSASGEANTPRRSASKASNRSLRTIQNPLLAEHWSMRLGGQRRLVRCDLERRKRFIRSRRTKRNGPHSMAKDDITFAIHIRHRPSYQVGFSPRPPYVSQSSTTGRTTRPSVTPAPVGQLLINDGDAHLPASCPRRGDAHARTRTISFLNRRPRGPYAHTAPVSCIENNPRPRGRCH